jgi:hypothetical protein
MTVGLPSVKIAVNDAQTVRAILVFAPWIAGSRRRACLRQQYDRHARFGVRVRRWPSHDDAHGNRFRRFVTGSNPGSDCGRRG